MKSLKKITLKRVFHPFRIIFNIVCIYEILYPSLIDYGTSFLDNYLENGDFDAMLIILTIVYLIATLAAFLYLIWDVFGKLKVDISSNKIIIRKTCLISFKKKVFKRRRECFFKVIHFEPKNPAHKLAQGLDIRPINSLLVVVDGNEHKILADISVRRAKENILKINRFLKQNIDKAP